MIELERGFVIGIPAPQGRRFDLTAGASKVGRLVRFDGILYRVAAVTVDPDGSALRLRIQRVDS
jgi:hypothetical protein